MERQRNAGRSCHAAMVPRISLSLHPGYGDSSAPPVFVAEQERGRVEHPNGYHPGVLAERSQREPPDPLAERSQRDPTDALAKRSQRDPTDALTERTHQQSIALGSRLFARNPRIKSGSSPGARSAGTRAFAQAAASTIFARTKPTQETSMHQRSGRGSIRNASSSMLKFRRPLLEITTDVESSGTTNHV